MELSPFVARLQHELLAVADARGSEVRAVAERLVAPLDSAVRLVLIEVLTEAFDTVTTEIAPGSVHLRLRGRARHLRRRRRAADHRLASPQPLLRLGRLIRASRKG